jgi:urease accessory protein
MSRSSIYVSDSVQPAAPDGDAPPKLAARHQRVDGLLRLHLHRAEEGGTRVSDLFQRAPCRVLFPAPEPGDPPLAVLLTTSGGLTGGDRTAVSAVIGPHACATITTSAAEKIYRALQDEAETQIRVGLQIREQAWGEWLAQETILFDGARLRRSLRADVAQDGRLLALESIVLGRTGMGERFDTGLLHDEWEVRREGRLIWIDAMRLEGEVAARRAAPFGLGMCVAYSTLLYVAADAARRIDAVRDTLAKCGDLGGATLLDGMLIVRAVAERAHELRAAMTAVACTLRREAGPWPARLPRVWSC